jgi:predicted metal-dependent phosphotriesterase family hydrolase
MNARIRTVLGDIAPGELGATDYHEHLFQVSPLLPGDDLDDEAASGREAALLRTAGAGAMVEATPTGLGRRPEAVARVSAATGLRIVHVTGAHREVHYSPGDPLLAEPVEALATRFAADLHAGMDGTTVRAGALKAGAGYWWFTGFERRVLTAVGQVAAGTGAPVMVHLEHGSAAHEVLDLLTAEGCPAERVVLAHVDRNPDPGLHCELAARGAYLGYDGAARHQRWPDSVLIDCLAAVVAAGGGERVLLGGDVARRTRYVAYGGMPGLAYLFDRFVPRVRAAVGGAALDAVLVANPARWLSWEPAR